MIGRLLFVNLIKLNGEMLNRYNNIVFKIIPFERKYLFVVSDISPIQYEGNIIPLQELNKISHDVV